MDLNIHEVEAHFDMVFSHHFTDTGSLTSVLKTKPTSNAGPCRPPRKSAATAGLISDDEDIDDDSILVAETQITPQIQRSLGNSPLVHHDSVDESILVAETQVTPRPQLNPKQSGHEETVDESPGLIHELDDRAVPVQGSSPVVADSDGDMETQGFPDIESDEDGVVQNGDSPASDKPDSAPDDEEVIESADSDNDSLLEMETQGFQEQFIDDSDTELCGDVSGADKVSNNSLLALETQAVPAPKISDSPTAATTNDILDMETQAMDDNEDQHNSSSILVPETQPDRRNSTNSTAAVDQSTEDVEESVLHELETQAVRISQANDSVVTIEGELDRPSLSEPCMEENEDDLLAAETQAVPARNAEETQDLLAAETQAVEGGCLSPDPDDSDLLVAETQATPQAADAELVALETQAVRDAAAGPQTCDILDMETQAVPESDDDDELILSMQTQAIPAAAAGGDDSADDSEEEPEHSAADSILNMQTQAVPLAAIEEDLHSDDECNDSAESILNMQTQAVALHSSSPDKAALYEMETQAVSPTHNSDHEASAESILNMQTQAVGLDKSIFNMQTQAVPVGNDAEDAVASDDDEDLLLSMQTQAVPMRRVSESDDDDDSVKSDHNEHEDQHADPLSGSLV